MGIKENKSPESTAKIEPYEWIYFNRETDYDGLSFTSLEDEVIVGENLRSVVEKKLFDNALDEKFLQGLFQDDITEKYCNGKLPTSIEAFVFMIMSCPIIEDEEEF